MPGRLLNGFPDVTYVIPIVLTTEYGGHPVQLAVVRVCAWVLVQWRQRDSPATRAVCHGVRS